jgi:hypothetical protein
LSTESGSRRIRRVLGVDGWKPNEC